MVEGWIPLASGLVGALIGSVSSVAIVLIQARREEQRHLRELAMQLAAREWDLHAAIIQKRGGALAPMKFYLAEAMKTIVLLNKKELTADDLIRSAAESRAMLAAMIAADPDRPD